MSLELAKSRMSMGPSRPTLYQFELPVATTTQVGVSKDLKQYLQYYARDLSIPSVSHEIMPVIGQSNMGITRFHPTAMKFVGNQFTITVLENSDFTAYDQLRGLFDMVGVNYNPTENGSRTQRLKYYDDYVFQVEIQKLEFPDTYQRMQRETRMSNQSNDGYKMVAKYTFNNCYVAKIGDISMSSDMYDTVTTFQVTFNFETYEYDYRGANDKDKYKHMEDKDA